MMPDAAWIRQGHAIYMAEGWVLHIKNEVSDTLQHGALTILKYLRVIMQLPQTSQALKVVLNDFPADFEIPNTTPPPQDEFFDCFKIST